VTNAPVIFDIGSGPAALQLFCAGDNQLCGLLEELRNCGNLLLRVEGDKSSQRRLDRSRLWANAYHSGPLSDDLRPSDCCRTGTPLTQNLYSHFGFLLARMRYLNFICSATRSDPSNALNGFKPSCL
jgi:hypothetical protein